jgi:hypothetical protein
MKRLIGGGGTGTPGPAGTVSAAGSGTAAAPGIAFASDPNTGIYNPGADQLAVATNGVGRLFVDASGKVGVGTASPSAPLTFAASTGRKISFYQGTEGYSIGVENSEFRFVTDAGGVFTFKNGGTYSSAAEFARIDSSGRLGIGTSAPSDRLTILGGGQANTGIVARFGNSTGALAPSKIHFTDNYLWDWAIGGNSSGEFVLNSGEGGSTAGTTRMIITGTGNVGVGTASPLSRLHVEDSGEPIIYIRRDTTSATSLGGPIWRNNGFNVASIITQNLNSNSADLTFSTSSGGSLSERVRLTSDGKFLVGTSSARQTGGGFTAQSQVEGSTTVSASSFTITSNRSADDLGPRLNFARSKGGAIGSNTIVDADAEYGGIYFFGADGTDTDSIGAQISAYVDGTPGANDMPGRLVFSTTADGAASPTERMRITSDGTILVGITSPIITSNGFSLRKNSYFHATNTDQECILINRLGTDGAIVSIRKAGTAVGSISVTATATAYNTSSDYRLKENVTPVSDGIIRLQQLKPSRFNFIADPDTVVDGFIAHEVQTIVPEAITGEKDAVDDDGNPEYQGIDQSKLVPLLTAALQEAIGEIESLKARVAALEAN